MFNVNNFGFDHIKKKHTLHCGKDCMKKFCDSLKEHATRIIRFKKKKMLPLTNKELKACEEARICYIFRKQFVKNSLMM